LPDQRIAFVADTENARQRLARERQLLQLLADRVHFEVPRIEWVDPHGNWDIRLKVPGEAGLTLTYAKHHQRILDEPALIPDTQRIILYHALTALAYLAWRVDDPEAHDRLSGRDKAGAYRWVRQAVAWALA
jgi:hypothetical protein